MYFVAKKLSSHCSMDMMNMIVNHIVHLGKWHQKNPVNPHSHQRNGLKQLLKSWLKQEQGKCICTPKIILSLQIL